MRQDVTSSTGCAASSASDVVRGERVAPRRIAGGAADVEPPAPLGGASVGERLLVDVAAGLALEAVVAHGLGRAERLLDVALLELAGLEHAPGPDAGVAVGL